MHTCVVLNGRIRRVSRYIIWIWNLEFEINIFLGRIWVLCRKKKEEKKKRYLETIPCDILVLLPPTKCFGV